MIIWPWWPDPKPKIKCPECDGKGFWWGIIRCRKCYGSGFLN